MLDLLNFHILFLKTIGDFYKKRVVLVTKRNTKSLFNYY